jgi:ankyrin repeat protein
MLLYHAWGSSGSPPRDDLLNEAQLYLPAGVDRLVLLAGSDSLLPALKLLLSRGELIDQFDGERFSALAHVVRIGNMDAAVRLLKLGASPQARVGPDEMPVALILVLTGNVEGIQAFKRAGVDFSRIEYRGLSAIDIARRSGDQRVIEAIGQRL